MWYYQVFKHNSNGEVWYGIHEYFPSVRSWTKEPVGPVGESIEDLKWQLKAMLADIDKHGVMEYSDDN